MLKDSEISVSEQAVYVIDVFSWFGYGITLIGLRPGGLPLS